MNTDTGQVVDVEVAVAGGAALGPLARQGKGEQGRVLVHSGLGERLEQQAQLAARGDRAAVEELLAATRPVVVRYCRAGVGRVGQTFTAADGVARKVCLAVLGGLSGYRAGGKSFLAFLYEVAVREVGEARRRGPRGDGGTVRLEGLPAQLAGLAEVLPVGQREVLLLRVGVGLSAEETADAVGMTPGAVRIAQHKALNELRRLTDTGSQREKV
jgi:RNA polymerase sigma-70 factor (ECF subfamily)